MAGTRKGKQGVSTSGMEKSPARRKREAKRRRAEEREWASKNGAVKTVRLPTPIGAAKERECVGNPYAGMRSGECAADPTYVVAGELPAGFVIAGVCDTHLSGVVEAFREYGSEEPLITSVAAYIADHEASEAQSLAEFRDVVGSTG